MRRNLDHRSVRLGSSLAVETRQCAGRLRVTEGEVIRRALRQYLLSVFLNNAKEDVCHQQQLLTQ